uniref:Uncharacterized protein n=1 Tax=Cacopsylla melanoneura TaxID=428564 RepID=A0A8D8LIF1_9HEMI
MGLGKPPTISSEKTLHSFLIMILHSTIVFLTNFKYLLTFPKIILQSTISLYTSDSNFYTEFPIPISNIPFLVPQFTKYNTSPHCKYSISSAPIHKYITYPQCKYSISPTPIPKIQNIYV